MPATGHTAEVMTALFTRAASLSIGSPAMPIAFPEPTEPFTKPDSGQYLEVTFFSNRPAWEGLSEGKLDQGLLQITVIWNRGQGLISPSNAAQQVMDHFTKGLVLTQGSTRVVVSKEPWANSPLADDTELRIPVTVPWVASPIV
jgi:hypothetical protein